MPDITEIYNNHAGLVRNIAWKYGIHRDDIDDVTQLVFLKIMKALPEYQDEGKLSGWVGRITRNTVFDYKQQYWVRNVERFSLGYEVEDSVDTETDYDRRELIIESLRELNDRQREVIFLRYVIGLSPAEIALRVGKTKSAVNLILFRANRNMKIKLIDKEVA
jgi:RNA polymerase sigma-70 factor (ECF subfamily)